MSAAGRGSRQTAARLGGLSRTACLAHTAVDDGSHRQVLHLISDPIGGLVTRFGTPARKLGLLCVITIFIFALAFLHYRDDYKTWNSLEILPVIHVVGRTFDYKGALQLSA